MSEEKNEFISLYLTQINNFERANSVSTYADIFCSRDLCVKKLKKEIEEDEKKKGYIDCIKNEKDIYKLLSKNLEKNEYLKKNVIKYLYGGDNFLLLKYASNGSLLDYIVEKGIDESIAKIIFKKILHCINAIHESGVCHLDLKPDNILLDKKFEIKISDFGYSASKEKYDLEKLEKKVGNCFFKSPEMFQNISYNGIKSDIFTLGITLYYLMEGMTLIFDLESKYKKKKEENVINKNNYKEYRNQILKDAKNKLSEECNYVLNQMLKEKGEERPSIKDILNYDWFNEIKGLSEEDQNKKVFDYFRQIQLMEETTTECKESIILSTQYESIFDEEEPKKIDKELFKLMFNILKINGNLNKIQFMNLLIHEIKNDKQMEKIKEIKPNKNILEFDIIIKDYNYEFEEDELIIRITLIKLKDEEDNCCYMNSLLLSGLIYHYYTYKKIIFKLAKMVASRTGSNQFKYE